MCAHHAQHPCTSTMYINTIQCAKKYHQWNVSTICLYQYANHVNLPTCQTCVSTNMPTMYLNQSSVSTISSNTYNIYECTKHAHQHVSPLVPSKYINHAPIPQQDESSYMYAKSTTKHVTINLLVGASTNVLEVYQSCINYRSRLKPPFTTSNTKHPTIHVLVVFFNR
jgi:hypothetical protein